MSIMENILDGLENSLAYVARHMIGKDLAGYCELMTSIGVTDEDVKRNPSLKDPYTLITNNNSLLTVFAIEGTFEITSDDDFFRMIDSLRLKMSGYMQNPGHSLTCAFEVDPDRSLDELMRLAEPQIVAARRIGITSEDIIVDRAKRNAPLVAYEQNLLVVYTHTSVFNKDEYKQVLTNRANDAIKNKLPGVRYSQNPAAALMDMKSKHDTVLEKILSDFKLCGVDGKSGILLTRLDAHEAIKRVRIMCNRERTSQKFRPVLPGDKWYPRGKELKNDVSDLLPPTLNYQICTNDVEVAKGGLVKTDELIHGNIYMELGPQEPQTFSSLLTTIDRSIPWRIRFDLEPKGLNMLRTRDMIASFTGMLSSNRDIRQSFLDLKEIEKLEPVCSMKISLSTWSNTERETKRRLATLEKAIQSWGICNMSDVHGDPVAAWASTIPAFTTRNTANRMLPPLSEALKMYPLQRPATPWGDKGSLIMRTPDGKIYPIGIGSRLQDTWIELISAPPGSGKSVLLNSMNLATIHRPGSVRLPLMTIIDVGPSSAGLIDLIRDSLPERRKHEVATLKLQNSINYAVNPWDTQLGCRYPTTREKEFLADFMTLLCIDARDGVAPSGVSQVNEMLLDIAYTDKANKSANLYEPNVDAVVDKVLEETGLKDKYDSNWWLDATWWEVVDMLFTVGEIHAAGLAQRQAVPVLSDFGAYLNDEGIKQLFKDATIPGGTEPILSYMSRCFTSASTNFALFSGRTRFELNSETRIISIDLNDVVGGKSKESQVRSAIMYLFARQLAAKNYFLRDEIILPVAPQLYHSYHMKRVADVQDEQKTISYDELHNTGGLDVFEETIIKDGREGRKWGIRIIGASQYLTDYKEKLLHAATAVYVMRGGNVEDENVLKETFKVSDEAIRQLQRFATGPSKDGGNFLAIFKTKLGQIVQLLTNTIGPIEAWAFSTTAEDVALRNRLYKRIGTVAARRILATEYPLGSAMEKIESMRLDAKEDNEHGVIETLARELENLYLLNKEKVK
ncbi:IncI1 plasmid conjugative transfer protein TraU [Acinetobacter junii CIP 107470 = MTCC 11364]|uniref:IncI1 plasmid conjugative transfer protein TraU n=1 Tax=Acinetobacter junii CIP 107470 = MTCC 11364 TaxID=1217666 RepID=S7WRS6_ACIJU|nr:hypothetical protein [Acinetobacter junii]ENV52033.1 hypothetical protein F953_00523 [Acinetobacter junii CIP 107470 = MTCC 11364]EPR85840.1 IncI1 plasmid conjugative transfer protein TraU [Acinetobacter junii CIP 107470 = MTCC 11364]